MSRWTATTWTRAISPKVNSKEIVRACLETETMTLKAIEWKIEDTTLYCIYLKFHDERLSDAENYQASITKNFYNKEEANALWVVLRRKWFPNL